MSSDEHQYLNLVRQILETGVERTDRTGTGTLSIFGAQMRFSLRNNVFPLLTTKKVFWRGVVEELLWMISGSTDARVLSKKGVHIWDEHGSREYLDSIGQIHRDDGDLGPIYGFQWRYYGVTYRTCEDYYQYEDGIDQLAQCVKLIKKDPTNRRIIMTAWNPKDIPEMALPPCHCFCQFYVANGELSCQLYQRSADVGLGVPFNIASYSLLTRMMANVCGLLPGEFIHTIGDAHIYLNHVDALKEQIARPIVSEFPTLEIIPEVTSKNIDAFVFEDFKLVNYTPQASIKMTMAI